MPIAVRPTAYAGWASGASGYVAEPIAADKAQGFLPTGVARSSYFNWLQNANYNWQFFLDHMRGAAHLGDGSDGSLALGGSGGTPTNYVMQRHMQFVDVAIGISGALDTNGYIPYIQGVLTGISGLIKSNGGNGGTGNSSGMGASGVPGSAGIPAVGPLRGGWGGGTGATGIFAVGPVFVWGAESLINSIGGLVGGTGTSGAASKPSGLGGTAIAPSGLYSMPPANTQGYVQWLAIGMSGMQLPTGAYLRGGPGGGIGGPSISSEVSGGGGGAGGSVVLVVCQEVNWVGTIECKGGDGGAGGFNSGGGGGGGAGGRALMTTAIPTQCVVRVDARGGVGAFGNVSASGLQGGNGATGGTGLTIYRL